MSQRWVSAIILLFLAGTIVVPVSAHTTLGDLNGSPQFFRSNDHELNPSNTFGMAHVPGPLGFVWPGSGLDGYTGSSLNPPGYQSPFETFENPLQAAGHSYSPEGAILASTPDHDNVGDFVFAINFSQPQRFNPNRIFNYTSLVLYIPAPIYDRTGQLIQDGFEPTNGINWGTVGVPAQYTYNTRNVLQEGVNANIVTTITDDYGSISVSRADPSDPFGPGWWMVIINAPRSGISFTKARNWSEVYYVRINQMRTPQTAGRYFFKMFLNDSYPLHSQSIPAPFVQAMPMENWPVLLVKGEVDPAIISGTLRYGDLNATLFGTPLQLPGKVRAVGVAIDPITGDSTGRPVEARGYFNATAKGHFEVEGVAPGIYDIYASAAGYPEQKVAENVRVSRGQSLQLDLYLKVGPELRGTVYSKENFGEIPWTGERPIQIVIFDSKLSSYSDPQSIQSFSPANLTHAPFTSYVVGNTVFCPGDVRGNEFSCSGNGLLAGNSPKQVAFPWLGPVGYYTLTPPPAPGSMTSEDPFGLFNGVGPAQKWWVDPQGTLNPADGLGSTSSEFVFQFGSESVYGVPTKLSGMVPQIFATWTNGLSPGQYYIRVFLNGYVQTDYTGGNFIDYSFVVSSIGAQDISVPIDLFQSSTINVTVHFHDFPGTLIDGAVGGPDPARFLIAEAFSNTDGTMAAFNFTQVYANNTEATISLNGFGMAGSILPSSVPSISDPREFIKYSLSRYRGLGFFDYGLPTDTYSIYVYMRGYIQALPPATTFDDLDKPTTISASIGSKLVQLSTHMFRGGGVNVTLDSIDWEQPPIDQNWVWNGASVSLLVYDFPSKRFQDVIFFWDNQLPQPTLCGAALCMMGGNWIQPQQNSNFNTLSYSTWQANFGPGASYIMTNGSASVDRFGPDIPSTVDLYEPDSQAQSALFQFTDIFTQEIFQVGFIWNSTLYRLPTSSPTPFRSNIAIYPGTYSAAGWTYGYVQDNVAAPGDIGNVLMAVSWLGSIADIRVQLIVGVNFTLSMIFKDERIISGLAYDSSVRIRIYDQQDTLIAATTLYSDISTNFPSVNLPGPIHVGFFGDGKPLVDRALQPLRPFGVPAGTKDLTYVDLAGLFRYTDPGSSNIQINTRFSFDHGVWGNSMHPGAYDGSWTVMVDVVNWYLPTSFSPPVPGLLQGESPYFFPYNHLGPFAQNGWEIVSNVWQGGEASAIFELDQRGLVEGTVLAMNWFNATRTASWIGLLFTQNSSSNQYYWYTWDGFFDGYLDPGLYQMTVTEWIHNEGHISQQLSVSVTPGENSKSTTIILEESGIAIPPQKEAPSASSQFARTFSNLIAKEDWNVYGRSNPRASATIRTYRSLRL